MLCTLISSTRDNTTGRRINLTTAAATYETGMHYQQKIQVPVQAICNTYNVRKHLKRKGTSLDLSEELIANFLVGAVSPRIEFSYFAA